ncbi:MAG TPA: hypothetical protein VGM69_24600 [Chloroflexota bacterium]
MTTTSRPDAPARPGALITTTPPLRAARPWWRDPRFLAVLAATLAVAALLRLYRLDGLPPGLSYDEAWEGLDGVRILAGDRPIFLTDNNGREPLFAYSVAAAIALLGPTALAVRAAAAFWGVLTVASMAFLGGVLGGRGLALAAAGLVAVSYWPLHMSRLGMRSVALPALEALALGLLFLALGATFGRFVQPAWRRPWPRRLAALGAGLALGLSLYTYLPARLLAFVAAAAVLAAALGAARRGGRAERRVVAETLLIAAVVGLVVAAPLARYYWRNPDHWLGRAAQVSVLNEVRGGAEPRAVLLRNLRATVEAFALRGDAQPRHNLPGRPIFDPLGVLLFGVGLLWVLWRFFTVAGWTILVWLGAMLVPAWLSDSAPHALRAMGALPPVYLVAALGLIALRRLAAGWSSRGAAALVAFALAFTAALAARDYFVLLPADPRTAAEFDASVSDVAAYLRTRPTGGTVVVGPVEPGHPALRYLAPGQAPRTFPVAATPLLPAGPDGLEYFLPGRDMATLALFRAAYPGADVAGQDGFTLVRVPPGAAPAAPPVGRAVGARIGPLELLGADVGTATGGTELPVRLLWRVADPVQERLQVFLHLVDASGRAWARESLEPGLGVYPTEGWLPGQIVVEERRLPLPPGVPPGDYLLRVGLVRPSGDRLPLSVGPGAAAEFAALPGVHIGPGGRLNLWRLPLGTQSEVDLAAGDARVHLVGYRVERDRLTGGEAADVLLVWEGRGPAPGLRAELVLLAGDTLLAREAQPVGGNARPIDGWITGELLQDLRSLRVPATAPAGAVDLWLRLLGADGAISEPLHLGTIEVAQRPRVFQAPSPEYPLGIRFGDFAELVGYDLGPGPLRPGGTLSVKLYWRARAPSDRDYVVFVHLVDALDRIHGQVDAQPAGGGAPTRTWVPGEVIVDQRTITIAPDAPPGPYRLAVGFYLPDSGERVPAVEPPLGDRALFGNLALVPG